MPGQSSPAKVLDTQECRLDIPKSPMIVPESDLTSVRLAIATDRIRHRNQLQQALESSGLQVVLCEPVNKSFVKRLQSVHADVLLLDMDENIEHEDGFLDKLLDQIHVPIIFNDVSALTLNEPRVLAKWYGKLLRKIAELTGKQDRKPLDIDIGSQLLAEAGSGTKTEQGKIAESVWVLGASLGGPEAVKRFLHALPADLPVAFILAQHLGANFVALIAEQLDQCTAFQVLTPHSGYVLRHQQVLVTPVHERMLINSMGAVELHPLSGESHYTPSIDTVLDDVASRYGKQSGAIIFSGMGNDGIHGCRSILAQGGVVWAQSADSCVISSMPDSVRDLDAVSYNGDPEQLANKLVDLLSPVAAD